MSLGYFCHISTLLLLLVSLVTEADTKARLDIAFQIELPPHSYMKDGRVQGIDVALIKEAALRAGFEPHIYLLSLQRVLQRLQIGSLDLGSIMLLPTSPFGKNAKGTVLFDYAHTQPKFYLYARKQQNIKIKNMPDMLAYRVGQHEVATFYNHPDFPNSRPVTFFRNHSILLSALYHGRVDIAVADELNAAYSLQANPALSDEKIEPIFYIDTAHLTLLASKKSLGDRVDSVQTKIVAALQEIKQDGTLKQMLKEYDLLHMEDLYLAAWPEAREE